MWKIRFREYFGEVRDANDEERSFSHPISDESIDAHGSIIRVDGWDLKRFKANPIVLFAHNSSDLPIGRSTKIWKEDGRLMTRTQFAGLEQMHPFAETAYKLVRDGFIRAWSVGFMPRERAPREDIKGDEGKLPDPYLYTKQELMEYSLVPIPSNPHALLQAKNRGIDTDPVMAWFREHREIADFYTTQGFKLELDSEDLDDLRQEGFEVQTLIFPKDHWDSAGACKAWARDHDFKAGAVDETEDSYRIRQRDPGDFVRLRTICVNPGDISAGSDKCKVKAAGGPIKKAAPAPEDDDMFDDIHQIIIEEAIEEFAGR
jgi:HK97 family phage prohead protease